MGNITVRVNCIVSPLGSRTEIPCLMVTLMLQGLFGPMKCLLQPESTMALLSLDGWRVITRVLQENKLFKTKEYLGLKVPCLHQGAGLKLLFVPPFWLWQVASLW